ncbi:hypothetical protein SAMD00019534_050270, partial [Acytostelium subglobosum LB1]|uniref:hypothetical protein n=1 Tax=Acytostelium subglobosum LB1 TaxID=1410327 RepID=UPI000644C056
MNRTIVSSSSLFIRAATSSQQRNMATLKELKVRLGTVKTISKLTKTLHMVASSKLRAAEKKAEELGSFNDGPAKLLAPITSIEGLDPQNTGEERSNKQIVIGITTDTGMCGPVNHNVVRLTKGLLNADTAHQMTVNFSGLKGAVAIGQTHPASLASSARDFGKMDYSFPESLIFLNNIIKLIPNFDAATIVFNKFKNAMVYNVATAFVPGYNLLEQHRDKFDAYQTSEDRSATMKDLSEFSLATTFWVGLFQNRASETAARMISMDNASKNGEQISQALSLQYNRVRQAMITSELIEITSGAAAIEEGN